MQFWCSYEAIWKLHLQHDIGEEGCFPETHFSKWVYGELWLHLTFSSSLKIRSVCNFSSRRCGYMFKEIFLNNIGFTDFLYVGLLTRLSSFSSTNTFAPNLLLKIFFLWPTVSFQRHQCFRSHRLPNSSSPKKVSERASSLFHLVDSVIICIHFRGSKTSLLKITTAANCWSEKLLPSHQHIYWNKSWSIHQRPSKGHFRLIFAAVKAYVLYQKQFYQKCRIIWEGSIYWLLTSGEKIFWGRWECWGKHVNIVGKKMPSLEFYGSHWSQDWPMLTWNSRAEGVLAKRICLCQINYDYFLD